VIYAAIEWALTALTVISIAVCVFRAKNYRVAAALATTLVTSYFSSQCNNYLPIGGSLFLAWLICIVSFREGDKGMLDIESNEVNYAISFALMLRMPFVIFHAFGWLSLSHLWISAIIFVLLENLLILGGYANGNARNINNNITNFRVMCDEIIFSRRRV